MNAQPLVAVPSSTLTQRRRVVVRLSNRFREAARMDDGDKFNKVGVREGERSEGKKDVPYTRGQSSVMNGVDASKVTM